MACRLETTGIPRYKSWKVSYLWREFMQGQKGGILTLEACLQKFPASPSFRAVADLRRRDCAVLVGAAPSAAAGPSNLIGSLDSVRARFCKTRVCLTRRRPLPVAFVLSSTRNLRLGSKMLSRIPSLHVDALSHFVRHLRPFRSPRLMQQQLHIRTDVSHVSGTCMRIFTAW